MRQGLEATWAWLRVQFFRFWTALVVLGTYGYLWLNKPEYLSWWKRSVDSLIETSSGQLPYPWGTRLNRLLAISGFGSK
jgi:hypothetical protein